MKRISFLILIILLISISMSACGQEVAFTSAETIQGKDYSSNETTELPDETTTETSNKNTVETTKKDIKETENDTDLSDENNNYRELQFGEVFSMEKRLNVIMVRAYIFE